MQTIPAGFISLDLHCPLEAFADAQGSKRARTWRGGMMASALRATMAVWQPFGVINPIGGRPADLLLRRSLR